MGRNIRTIWEREGWGEDDAEYERLAELGRRSGAARRKKRDRRRRIVLALHAAGMSRNEIMEATGISRATFYRYLETS